MQEDEYFETIAAISRALAATIASSVENKSEDFALRFKHDVNCAISSVINAKDNVLIKL